MKPLPDGPPGPKSHKLRSKILSLTSRGTRRTLLRPVDSWPDAALYCPLDGGDGEHPRCGQGLDQGLVPDPVRAVLYCQQV